MMLTLFKISVSGTRAAILNVILGVFANSKQTDFVKQIPVMLMINLNTNLSPKYIAAVFIVVANVGHLIKLKMKLRQLLINYSLIEFQSKAILLQYHNK